MTFIKLVSAAMFLSCFRSNKFRESIAVYIISEKIEFLKADVYVNRIAVTLDDAQFSFVR